MLATPVAHKCLIDDVMAFKASNPGTFLPTLCEEKAMRWQGNLQRAEPDDDEELAEQYALLTDEQMLEKVSVAVQSEIGVKHTMVYDV